VATFGPVQDELSKKDIERLCDDAYDGDEPFGRRRN
jgi:hypothetical protein